MDIDVPLASRFPGLPGGERAELWDQPGDVHRDLVLPRGFGPDRHQLALAAVQVEPGGTDIGAVEDEILIALSEACRRRIAHRGKYAIEHIAWDRSLLVSAN